MKLDPTTIALVALTGAVMWLGLEVGRARRDLKPILTTLDRFGVT